jgi:hypothetical protein
MTGIGSSMMAAHMAGKDLSPGQAIKAKCADCMGKTKRCSKCGEHKTLDHFGARAKNSDKLKGWCRECERTKNREWFKNNPEQYRQIQLNWVAKHPYRYWARRTLNHHKELYSVSFDIDWLEKRASETTVCEFCGVVLRWPNGAGNRKVIANSPTLERINNEQHLTKNNIKIICHRCNVTKQDRTFKEFVRYCKMIATRFQGVD